MKLVLLLSILNSFSFCNHSLGDWINDIAEDMIEMNDLSKYSLEQIAADKKINFHWVEEVSEIQIQDSTFSFLISSSNNKFCTKLTFLFTHVNGKHYLKFAEPKPTIVFNKEILFIDPWIKSEKVCD